MCGISNFGAENETNTLRDHDEVEFVVESDSKRKRSTVSPSDLTIHENIPENPVIKKSLSTPEEQNKRNGINSDEHVARYVTSSSSLNIDNIHANCLPPDYCVSKQSNIYFFFSFCISIYM